MLVETDSNFIILLFCPHLQRDHKANLKLVLVEISASWLQVLNYKFYYQPKEEKHESWIAQKNIYLLNAIKMYFYFIW